MYVTIGTYNYPVIKVGNLLWIAENFKEDVGGGVWYNNDASNEQKMFGRLYPASGYGEIRSILPDGWRISTKADWANILSLYSRSQLCSLYWNSGEQPNVIGFNATGCGCVYADSFMWLGDRCIFGYNEPQWENQVFLAQNGTITGWSGDDRSTYYRQKFTIRITRNVI